MKVERSTNLGKTWESISVSDRSVVAYELSTCVRWNDGCGNLYRHVNDSYK